MMPVSGSECGRRQPRRHNNKCNGVRQDQVQAAELVNGTTRCDKMTYVYGPRTIYPTQAASDNGIRPRNMMNGYANNGFSSNRHEITSEYSRAKPPECNGSPSVNESRSLGSGPPTTICSHEPTRHDPSAATKIQRKKKPWHKKRNNHVAHLENGVPQSTEDWEGEIREVKISNWEKMSFGTQPYGQDDLVNFTQRNFSLESSHPPLWQVTCNKYLPATHHQRPMEWFRYKPCSEPGQFSDAED